MLDSQEVGVLQDESSY